MRLWPDRDRKIRFSPSFSVEISLETTHVRISYLDEPKDEGADPMPTL